MTHHLHKHIPHPCQPGLATVRRFPNRKCVLISLAALVLVLGLASCSGGIAPPPVVDTEPIGAGLKLIGFALIGVAVVMVLGRLIR